jgi:hypothetical protein
MTKFHEKVSKIEIFYFLEKFEFVDYKIIAVKVKEQVFFNSFQMVQFYLSIFLLKNVYVLQFIIKNFMLRK